MNARMIVAGIYLMAGTGCVSHPPTIAHAHIGHAVAGVAAAIDAAANSQEQCSLQPAFLMAANHASLAAASPDASDNLQQSAPVFARNVIRVVERCELIALLGKDLAASGSEAEAGVLTAEINKLAAANLDGEDADGDGKPGGTPAEYGVIQLRAELDALVARENPPYRTVDPRNLSKVVPVQGNVSEQHLIEEVNRAAVAARAERNLLRCAQLSDVAACDEAVEGRPNDAQILVARGDALLKANRPVEAAAAFRRAVEIKLASDALPARIAAAEELRAKLALDCTTGSGAVAVQACDAALVRGGADEFTIQRRKGRLLQGMGESSRALDAYMAAETVKPGDRSGAVAIVALTERGKRRDAIALEARGSALLTLKRPGEAAAALRQAKALSPELPDVNKKLAAAERLARTQRQRAEAPAVEAAAAEPPARVYSNEAPTSQSR